MHKALLFLLALVLIVGLISCSKDSAPTIETGNMIIGHWQWVESNGGIAGVHLTPENTGNSQMLIYLADGVDAGISRFYRNDTLLIEAAFELTAASWDNQIWHDAIDYSGDQPTQFYSFSAKYDTLYLSDFIVDGFNSVYIRVR